MIVYRIRRRSDGHWSRGGTNTVSQRDYDRNRVWTSDFRKAKIWKRRSDLNCHLSAINVQCERYGGIFPQDWEVVTFEIREEELYRTFLKTLRYDGN